MAQEQAVNMAARVQQQMDEGTAGSGRVADDDGDDSSSGSDGNEAAAMPVTRKTVTEQNNAPTAGDAD